MPDLGELLDSEAHRASAGTPPPFAALVDRARTRRRVRRTAAGLTAIAAVAGIVGVAKVLPDRGTADIATAGPSASTASEACADAGLSPADRRARDIYAATLRSAIFEPGTTYLAGFPTDHLRDRGAFRDPIPGQPAPFSTALSNCLVSGQLPGVPRMVLAPKIADVPAADGGGRTLLVRDGHVLRLSPIPAGATPTVQWRFDSTILRQDLEYESGEHLGSLAGGTVIVAKVDGHWQVEQPVDTYIS